MNEMRIASELLFLARELVGIDFPTQDAMDKYLKDHPDADKTNHRVVETKKEGPGKKEETSKGAGKVVVKTESFTAPKISWGPGKYDATRAGYLRERGMDGHTIARHLQQVHDNLGKLSAEDQHKIVRAINTVTRKFNFAKKSNSSNGGYYIGIHRNDAKLVKKHGETIVDTFKKAGIDIRPPTATDEDIEKKVTPLERDRR